MILVADDDRLVRNLLMHTLSLGQFEAKVVSSGKEVLDSIQDEIPELIVMDVNMPEMTGLEVCRRLRAEEKTIDVPIILLSAETDERTMLEGLNGGADDYMTKPFQPAVLLAKVKATLRSRRVTQRSASILDLAPGTRVGGRFQVRAKVGHGAMGVVYRATDRENNVDVAVKIEHRREDEVKRTSRRFRREIEVLTKIDHPNVVRIYTAGYHNEHHFYAMQYVDGPSLRDRIDAQGAISAQEALRIAAEVAEGLAAVHEAGFVHRDVKPANILLDSKGGVRLGDFGVVFPMEADGTRLTLDGRLVGTLLYMSPEQLLGGDVDHRCDIYALGLVLHEMLTGVAARNHIKSPAELLSSAHDAVPKPRKIRDSIPPIAEALCLRACEPDPTKRYETAKLLRQALLEGARALDRSKR